MCAVCGVYWGRSQAPPEARRAVEGMLRTLGHRGPDGQAVHQTSQAVLGHARLHLVGGIEDAQPIRDPQLPLVLSCAGEIYGDEDLRAEFRSRGEKFVTGSDCELLLVAYRREGIEGLRRLDGQWAAALLDERAGKLILCRDRWGIAPLYYTQVGDAVYFASEIKALLTVSGSAPRPDAATVRDWMRCWSPLPGRTFFENISEVRPGCAVEVTDGAVRESRWWRPAVEAFKGTQQDAAVELRRRLDVSVRARACGTPAKVGISLSGGLDSSVIAASAASSGKSGLELFHVRVGSGTADESGYAEEVARRTGLPLRCVDHGAPARLDRIERAIRHAEQPLLRMGPLPMLELAEVAARAGVKALLTGEGADELLFGYDLYLETSIRMSALTRASASPRRQLLRRVHPDLGGAAAGAYWVSVFFPEHSRPADPYFSHAVRWSRMAELTKQLSDRWSGGRDPRSLFEEELSRLLPPGWEDLDPLGRARAIELGLFLPQYLLSAQGERMTMAFGIESRQPFLDHRLAEWILGLPRTWLLRGLRSKRLLRTAYAGRLPQEVLQRRKQPYSAPHLGRLVSAEVLTELIAEAERHGEGLLRPGAARFLADKCLKNGGQLTEGEGMLLNAAGTWEIFRRMFFGNGILSQSAV